MKKKTAGNDNDTEGEKRRLEIAPQPPPRQQPNIRTIATIILVFAALALGYAIVSSPAPEAAFISGKETSGSTFLANLAGSKTVYIVQDLRGANSLERKSIQQCGVDFAGSHGLVSKEKVIFAFEDANCVSLEESRRDIKSCILELEGKTVLYIRKGNNTKIYDNALLVGLGEQYEKGGCDVGQTDVSGTENNAQTQMDSEITDLINSS